MKFLLSPEVFSRFKEYQKAHPAWGNLHIVLDDCNFTDDSVKFCLNKTKEENDTEGEILCEYLLLMSKTQRRKLAKNGYFKNANF